MQTPSALIEHAKAMRERLRPATRTSGGANAAQAPASSRPMPTPDSAAFAPRHRLYDELMKKHDSIHPRR